MAKAVTKAKAKPTTKAKPAAMVLAKASKAKPVTVVLAKATKAKPSAATPSGGEDIARKFIETLSERGIETSAEQAEVIAAKMRSMLGYRAKVGFFGKTGVGKSSLCNALFGKDVASVSDVEACTRNPNEYILKMGGEAGIVLVDVPGVGESEQRDVEYRKLYKTLLPTLDVLVWVVKADDRAFTTEEKFFHDIVKPYIGTVPLLVAINQADKIEPSRKWNEAECRPGPEQEKNLASKRHAVLKVFEGTPRANIVQVAAVEKYGVADLLTAMVEALPRSKRIAVVREASKAARSEKAEKAAENGFWDEVWETTKKVVGKAIRSVKPETWIAIGRALWKAVFR